MTKIVKISKEEANRRLGDVPDDKIFWCHDGKVIKNLKELEETFDNMSDETFYYHSGKERKKRFQQLDQGYGGRGEAGK